MFYDLFVVSIHQKGNEIHYYHGKVNVRGASQVSQQPKTQNVRKLGSFQKITGILKYDGEYTAGFPKGKF